MMPLVLWNTNGVVVAGPGILILTGTCLIAFSLAGNIGLRIFGSHIRSGNLLPWPLVFFDVFFLHFFDLS